MRRVARERTPDAYERWLTDTLRAQLLVPSGAQTLNDVPDHNRQNGMRARDVRGMSKCGWLASRLDQATEHARLQHFWRPACGWFRLRD